MSSKSINILVGSSCAICPPESIQSVYLPFEGPPGVEPGPDRLNKLQINSRGANSGGAEHEIERTEKKTINLENVRRVGGWVLKIQVRTVVRSIRKISPSIYSCIYETAEVLAS